MPAQSLIKKSILSFLADNGGEAQGTECLALAIGVLNVKKFFIKCLRKLEADGKIAIIRSTGGRGHKTIYKLKLYNE